MSNLPNPAPVTRPQERNWLPLAIAAAVVLILAATAVFILERGKTEPTVTPISAAPDAYAANLPITRLAMSESTNLAGGKVTYLDGHVANQGARIVTGVTVQVLFRSFAHEVAQNETLALQADSNPRTLCRSRAGLRSPAEARRRARFSAHLRCGFP